MDFFYVCSTNDGRRPDWCITDENSIETAINYGTKRDKNSIEFSFPLAYKTGITYYATYLVQGGAIKVKTGPGRTPKPRYSWGIFNNETMIGDVYSYDISHLNWYQDMEEMYTRKGYVRCVRDL